MVDSTVLGDVVDECAAWAAELVVEGDGGGEGEEALEDACSQAGEGAGAVAFEGEDVFGGPEDAFDPLADRRDVRATAGFVLAEGPDDRGAEFQGVCLEVAAGVALVTDHGHVSAVLDTRKECQRNVAFPCFGAGELQGARGAVRGEQAVQPEAPEEPAVTGGRRSSAVQNTGVSSRSRSASTEAPQGRR